ncbi:MAG: hypothetical protein V2A73_21625 [Pseudomonadota bacterium]
MTRVLFLCILVAGTFAVERGQSAPAAAAALFAGELRALPAAASLPIPAQDACGSRLLPLAKGNSWTYRSGSEEVSISVKEVTVERDASGRRLARIELQETFAGTAKTTTCTCSPQTGLTVPPGSFLFSGEPSDDAGMAFAVSSHDGATYPSDGSLLVGHSWVETVRAAALRKDTSSSGGEHPAAQVEIERYVAIGAEKTMTFEKGIFRAREITFDLRGRSIVGEDKRDLQVKRQGVVWLVGGLGIIRIDDAFAKSWNLVSSNLLRSTSK